jgi:hypothetical protein
LVDTTPPSLITPDDITTTCTFIPPPENPIVNDNCDTAVEISLLEIITGDCPYTINRIWTATDDCGNETTDIQHIQVEDNEPPLFTDFDPFTEMSCDLVGSYMPTASDLCSDEVEISILNETFSPDECAGLLERLYQATDHCGNHTEVTQIIQIIDTTPPNLINIPQEITILCESELPSIPENISAIDNCDLNVNMEFTETESGSVCPYDIERTWTARDQCNNVTVAHQLIHVVFETGVVLQAFPNPANNEFTITFSSPIGVNIKLGVFDVIGNSVTPVISGITDQVIYSYQVDASRWNDGIYLIMLVADDEVMYERILVSNAN